MNCASELDTGMDHDAELEHVHGPEPACMIEHRHTPSPAQQGAQIGTAGGRVDYALALGQRRTRGPELDTELDHGADPAHVHRLKPALVTDHKGTPLHGGAPVECFNLRDVQRPGALRRHTETAAASD